MQQRKSLLFVMALTLVTAACGGGGKSPGPDPAPGVKVSVNPPTTTLLVRTSTKFTATVSGASDTSVTFRVMESNGGNVLNTGEYLAPIAPGTYTVRATSVADSSKFADAKVTVRDYTGSFTRLTPPDGYDYHTASLLNDGSVLIVGGSGFNEPVHRRALRYVPSTNTFEPDANLNVARMAHATFTLSNGKIVVTGGWDPNTTGTIFDPVYKSTEIYDPATKTFTAGPDMNFPRRHHVVTQLKDGRFLVTGGIQLRGSGFGASTNAEIYDSNTNTFTPTGRMNVGRWLHTATLLPDGRVLVAGGRDNNCTGTCPVYSLASAEIYDPATGVFTLLTGSLNVSRWGHAATVLQDGQVLLVGGENTDTQDPGMLFVTERFDPQSGAFTKGTSLGEARSFHTVTLLNNGKLLVAGGFRDTAIAVNSTEYFDPATGVSRPGPVMNEFHARHTATRFDNGEVLIFAGTYSSSPAAAAEIFK